MKTVQLTAIIEREGDGYVALCPDVDVASQGASIDEARANLQEAVEMVMQANRELVGETVGDEVIREPFKVSA